MSAKTQFVAALRPGDSINDIFAVQDCQVKTSARGPYLSGALRDRSGRVGFVRWGAQQREMDALPLSFVLVGGTLGEYGGSPQVNITSLRPVAPPADLSDFERCAPLSRERLRGWLADTICSIGDDHLRRAVGELLLAPMDAEGDGTNERFAISPAAVAMHHAVRHGLLQHSLEVAEIAKCMVDSQKGWGYDGDPVNRDLVIAGALLHDIGKTSEYSLIEGLWKYSTEGGLLGHIYLGAHLVETTCRALRVPDALRVHLIHIILSHHGELAHGSPVTPATREAKIVHLADVASARLNMMTIARENATEDMAWVKGFERPIFVGSIGLESPVGSAPTLPESTEPADEMAPFRAAFTERTGIVRAPQQILLDDIDDPFENH